MAMLNTQMVIIPCCFQGERYSCFQGEQDLPNPFWGFHVGCPGGKHVEAAKRLSAPRMFEHLQEDGEEDDDSEEAAFQNIPWQRSNL